MEVWNGRNRIHHSADLEEEIDYCVRGAHRIDERETTQQDAQD
jgi:hypothetical protein